MCLVTATSAEAVLDRMEVDSTFAQRVKEAGSPEASLALLRTEGFDVTAGDLRDALLDRYGDQLSSDDLDAVAGGISLDGTTLSLGSVAGMAGTVLAVAAAAV
jgi:predicted ribosomally synthesized peptide with nif11-like leader